MSLKDNFHSDDLYTADEANEVATAVNALTNAITQAGQIIPHADNADYARPDAAGIVIWVGSVQPNYAIDNDVWMDTSGISPIIETITLDSLNVASVFTQVLVASGTTPLIWSLVSGALPDGLTVSSDGNLYGNPTIDGVYDFTLKVVNPFGEATNEYSGTVGGAVSPTILTTSLGPVSSGVPLSVTLSVSGSVPIAFALDSGSLPTGLELNTSTGVISGTPTVVGSFNFRIIATNAVGYGSQTYTGSVAGVAPAILTTSLGAMWRAFAFDQTLSVSSSGTFAVQSGSLPAGLSLNTSTGEISGTPTTTGSYGPVVIRATNSYGHTDGSFSGSVRESTPSIVETALSDMTQSVVFAQTLTLSAGGPTITWSVQSGSLPAGLTLDTSTGEISGTPTTTGSYGPVIIRATNGTTYDDQTFSGSVRSAVSVPTPISAGTASTTPSWTGTVPTGTDFAVVCLHMLTTSSTFPTNSASIGGVAGTLIGQALATGKPSGSTYYGYMACYFVANPPTGSQTLTIGSMGGGGRAVPVYYSGNAIPGTPLTNTYGLNTSAFTVTTTAMGTGSNNDYLAFFGIRGTVAAMSSFQPTGSNLISTTTALGSFALSHAAGTGGNLTFSGSTPANTISAGEIIIPLVAT